MTELVFYADENEDELPVIQDAVDAIGGKLETFESGSELVEAMNNPPPKPKIVFVDLEKTTDGFKAVDKIRHSENSDVPIVIVSEKSNGRTIQKYRELGANLYINKCLSRLRLKTALEYALNINWKTFKPSKNFFYNRFIDR